MNKNKLVRKKGEFSKDFIDNVKNTIKTIQSDIVLLDVGGIPSRENAELFSHCDYFIILSRDKENIIIQSEILFEDIIRNEYYFNNKHKSPKLIASFESILDKNSKDIIYEEDGILLGKVTNLQRDKMPDSLKIKALANKLIKEIIIR